MSTATVTNASLGPMPTVNVSVRREESIPPTIANQSAALEKLPPLPGKQASSAQVTAAGHFCWLSKCSQHDTLLAVWIGF